MTNTYRPDAMCSALKPAWNCVVKKATGTASIRLAPAAPRGPKRRPAHRSGTTMYPLSGAMTPSPAERRCQVSAICRMISREASGNRSYRTRGFILASAENQVRMKGDSRSIAIALLPHQTFHD
jgi:hypothetical protein